MFGRVIIEVNYYIWRNAQYSSSDTSWSWSGRRTPIVSECSALRSMTMHALPRGSDVRQALKALDLHTLCIIGPHCIAMHRRAYILPVVFLCFFFRRLISEVTERISTKLDIHSLMIAIWKIWSKLLRVISLPPPRFGTDFELWANIPLQWNTISTIGKKFVNLQRLDPYIPAKFGEFWSRNGWKRLASFCRPPKFSHWETLPALSLGLRHVLCSGTNLQAITTECREDSRWALPCI